MNKVITNLLTDNIRVKQIRLLHYYYPKVIVNLTLVYDYNNF